MLILLSILVPVGVIAFNVSDVVRGARLRRSISVVASDFAAGLEKARGAVEHIEAIAKEFDSKKGQARAPSEKCVQDDPPFPNATAVLLEQYYTRLTVASGKRLFLATADASGRVNVRHMLTEQVFLSEEFEQPITGEEARELVTAGLEKYAELAALKAPDRLGSFRPVRA